MRAPELCQLARDWRGEVPAGGYALEQKIDGWRALYFRGWDGRPHLWTRGGHRVEGAGHIIHRLGMLEEAAGQHLFIDGEFQVDGTLAATKRWCESGWRAGGEAGLFHAFDVAPMAEWSRGGWDAPWHERKAWLRRLAGDAAQASARAWEWREGSRGRDKALPPVIVLNDDWACDVRQVLDAAERVWAAGGEGCMLKDAEAPYQRRRCDAWLKVKLENAHHWTRKAA